VEIDTGILRGCRKMSGVQIEFPIFILETELIESA
jgi:hypothetical protein